MAVRNFPPIEQCSTSFRTGSKLEIYPTPSIALLSYSLAGHCSCPRLCVRSGGSFLSRRSMPSSRRRYNVRRNAKFQQFNPSDEPTGACDELPIFEDSGNATEKVPEDERDDRVLPESLDGAVLQSSESAALFVQSGGSRAIVELLLPDVANLGEEGDQLKLWNLSRLFLEDLQSRLDTQHLKAIFPDAGVAAMLKYQWNNSRFTFASLSDRKPVNKDDEVVVLVQPDYQMLSYVEKIASSLAAEDRPPRPLIMYNPALQSGEVGIGLNVRRMREFFLSTFNPVYSMRSLSFGAIFRRYPGMWQVFFDDEKEPGRYVLASEEPVRPVLEDVEMLFLSRRNGIGDNGVGKEPGPLQNLVGMFSSMSRFMQSLAR